MALNSEYGILKRTQKPDKIAGFNLNRKLLSLCAMVVVTGTVLFFQVGSSKVKNDSEGIVLDLLAPFGAFFANCNGWINEFSDYTDHMGQLFNDAQLLKKLNNTNKQLQVSNTQLQYENALLREELGLVKRNPLEAVTARVLTHPSITNNNRLIIEGGVNKGMKKGAPVITSSGVVGKIERVSFNYSRVVAITSVDSRIPASIGVSRHNAIIAGNNSKVIDISINEKDGAFKKGDLVLTSGRGGGYPYGLLLGHISNAKVTPAVDFNKLDYVQVVTQSVFEQSDLDD